MGDKEIFTMRGEDVALGLMFSYNRTTSAFLPQRGKTTTNDHQRCHRHAGSFWTNVKVINVNFSKKVAINSNCESD